MIALLAPLLLAAAVTASERGATLTAPDTARVPASPPAFTRSVFATADDIPCPVAFSIDDSGTVWTANSLRYDGHGLFDNRMFPIVADDVTSTSLADRRRMTEKWVRAGTLDREEQKVTLEWLAGFSEQVRRLSDTDGDGRADRVTVAADGMNDLLQGGAAGVLAWDDRVYATIIPDLWLLRDSLRTGQWTRRSLQTGFGLHMGQAGHDMHGLTIGNDGRLYWSIADRGYDITTREGRRYTGHSGAVFRCWPDGSGLERWAQGLRNPQELAFTDAGDLFTGDNNADVGDRSRLLYLPQGADGGWLFYLQYVRGCGAWTREHMWETRGDGRDPAQPAWVLPPVDYLATCPSGMAAYPGTGLPARYDGSMWLVDYLSGVQSFRPVPRGAGFEMQDWHWAYRDSWGMSDVDFGPDGRTWVLYWGESWQRNDKSRLVALTPAADGVDTAAVAEVRALLRAGFAPLTESRLRELLGHRDRRVRRHASFELANRGLDRALADAAAHDPRPLARLHALWGLGIVGHARGGASVSAAVAAALADADADVRRVAAFTLGELGVKSSGATLVNALGDPSPRVRFAAAQAIAALRVPAGAALLDALAANDDADPMLRFAYARALAAVMPPEQLSALAAPGTARAVRLGAVLALREAGADALTPFLADADPQVATEAARTAYDLELPRSMAALAATLPALREPLRIEPYLRRALHAALRLGGAAQANAVAAFAADSSVSAPWRDEAVKVLAQWDRPDPRDGVLARWEPLPARAPGAAHAAIVAQLPRILACARGEDLGDAVELARREAFPLPNAMLLSWASDSVLDERARTFALRWLAARRAPESSPAIVAALGSRSDSLFLAGYALAAARDPARAVAAAARAYASPATPLAVRQAALRVLGRSAQPAATAFTTARLAELRAGTLDSTLVLDALEAGRSSPAPAVRSAARAARPGARASRDSLAALWPALRGGDATRGQRVFETHAAAQCVRCHTIDGHGGSVGPDLSLIGAHDRHYLLESVTTPNARIAPGFETTTLTLADGSSVTGMVKEEDAAHLVLKLDDASMRSVPRDSVSERPAGGSVMPPMLDLLQPGELRDVIEYLASRRDVEPLIPITTLTPTVATTGSGTIGRNRAATGGPLMLSGQSYAWGIGVRAPSRLVFPVPRGVGSFVARVGIDDASPGGQAGFELRVDGRSAWRSGPLKRGELAHAYAALAPGAHLVELLVDDGGNGIANDVADWAGAGFAR